MTRDELIEVMARAITGVSLGGPYPSAERMATAALLAIEAAGVRLVDVGVAGAQLIDGDERTTVTIFTPYAPPGD